MKNILVPIDFSAASTQVVDLAALIAKAFGSEIHLIHVKELRSIAPLGAVDYTAVGMPELMTSGLGVPIPESTPEAPPPGEAETQRLKNWQNDLGQAGVKTTLHESNGTIVEEILKKSDELQADLIVMGRHGHGAMYNLLVGSVTEGVLKRATRPVLLVPGPRS
ncbi:MAG: universal stress protein [Verrucomicrobiota bacterium]